VSTALYRRYRPESFAEVIGQEHVTVPLSAALDKDRVNHAYLFSGPRGCGKTTSARILARCLNCAQGPTSTPCGDCESCRDLARGGAGSLDVVEIDAASHGGVDDARSLRERAVFAPARDRYKVFIIDEAHMVSTQGFNALLKIVEEPPQHVRFVFATTEPEKVIGTIRSRTHHYPFRLVPPERLQAYLGEVCEREAVPVGPGVLPLVVRAGAGSVRDTLSVLDQLIAGAGPDGLEYRTAVALLGYTDGALLDDVVDALAADDGATVFRVVDRVIESGHDPRRFVEDLLERLRDLLVVAAVPDGGHAVFRAAPADLLERMRGQAARFGRAELSRAADVVNAALTEMTGATSPRLQLELLCARLLLPAADDGERGVRARVDRIERRLDMSAPAAERGSAWPVPAAPLSALPTPQPVEQAGGRGWPDADVVAPSAPVASAPTVAPTSAPSPVPTPSPARTPPSSPASASSSPAVPEVGPGAAGAETVRRMWPDVMARLAGTKRTTWSLVSHYAQVIDLDGKRLVLQFDSPGRAASFTKGAHQEFLRQALIDVLGMDCTFDAVAGEARPAQPAASPAVSAPSAPHASAPVPVTALDPAAAAAPADTPADTAAATAAETPEPPPSAPPPPAAKAGGAASRRVPARPAAEDDIPLPPEPPPDDVPPEEGPYERGRRLSGSRPSPAEGVAPPTAPPAPAAQRQPAPAIRLADDVPSVDDIDLDGSGLVGASVVEQLLGGRVIEERHD
jgi:DNA polymerase III subunit gamma/tau